MLNFYKLKFCLFFVLSVASMLCLWSLLVPLAQAPDEERQFSTVIWYAQPETLKRKLEPVNTSINTFNPATYSVPDEYASFLNLIDFNNERWNLSSHVNYNNDDFWGPEEQDFSTENQDQWFTSYSPTIVPYQPLYYWSASQGYKLVSHLNIFSRFLMARWITALWTLLALFFAYKIARLLELKPPLAMLATAVIAFQPMFAHIGTVVNVDMTLTATVTAFVYFGLRFIKEPKIAGSLLGMLLTFLGAIFTKPPGYFLVFILILVGICGLTYHWATWKKRIWALWLIIAPGSLFFLSQSLSGLKKATFNFDFFWQPDVWTVFLRYLSQNFPPQFISRVLFGWWGYFGWMDVPLPYLCYLIATGIALILFVSFIVSLFAKQQALIRRSYLILMLTVIIFSLAIWAYDFSYSYHNNLASYGMQGRYFFPVLPILFLLLIRGAIWKFTPAKQTLILVVIFCAMVFFNIFALTKVITAYYL